MAKFSILLVDDDPRYRNAMSAFLDMLDGVDEVRTAENGRAAVDLVLDGGYVPDLVLLDLFMPVMSGMEALPVLRRHLPPESGIIVLSSAEGRAYRRATAEVGGDAFVQKIEAAMCLPRIMGEVRNARHGAGCGV